MLMRRRGARPRFALLGALLTPLLWLAKELWRMSAVFSMRETLFYALNPLCVGLFAWAALQAAVIELLMASPRRLRVLRSVPGLYLLGVGLAAAAMAELARRGDAQLVFCAYIDVYRRLFGS